MPASPGSSPAASRNLAYGTVSFALCFAAWGLISAFASAYRVEFELSARSTAFLVAVPVLLGSLARIPLGMLTDRFGGRLVFTALFLAVGTAAALVPGAADYRQLVACGFLLGLAGSSFAVGVGFVSRWFPPEKQGTALGIYGLGNMGHSAAVFLGPLAAGAVGRPAVFFGVAALCVVWGLLFYALARDAPVVRRPATLADMAKVLAKEPLAWVLSGFYFVTFGGFVAFSVYLPALLRDEFRLSLTDAGLRAAGFVVLATLTRPLGGYLSDQIGGARVLSGVFAALVPFALLLSWPAIVPFTVGALGCGALVGAGSGAVFKLVPQFFPNNTATITGLVGAMGGLGGFFPPLVLGVLRDRLGYLWPGFFLLAATAALMWMVNHRVFLPRQRTAEEAAETGAPLPVSRRASQFRAGAWATVATALLAASIVVGSRNLQNFDPALVIYTFAAIFATWGIVYHHAVWLQKPPTRRFFQRSLELLWRGGLLPGLGTVGAAAAVDIAGQTFIRQRSPLRWAMHQCLFWGCVTAAAITFPLVFGWIHFGSAPGDQMAYVTYLFGFPVGSMRVRTALSWIVFHGLDFSAVLVLTGIALSLWRRLRDRGALTLQNFSSDFLPIILLFSISVTGLALTASSLWFRGEFYGFLAILHAVTVVGALLYLPFGKFFHIFQRPAQLGVRLYRHAGDRGEGAYCARCGQRFASQMQIDDLNRILPELGFDYRIAGPAGAWTALCPACKRTSLAAAQLRIQEEARG